MSEKYKSLKKEELTEILKKNKLPTTGKKDELIDRLLKFDEEQAIKKLEKEFELDFQNNTTSAKIDLDDVALSPLPLDTKTPPLKESVLSDDEDLDSIINQSLRTSTTGSKAANTSTASKCSQKSDTAFEKKPAAKPAAAAAAKTAKPTATVVASALKVTSSTAKTATSIVNSTVKVTSAAKKATSTTATTTKTSAITATAPTSSDTKDTKFKFTPITFNNSKPKTNEQLEAEKLKQELEKKFERSKRFGVKLDDSEMKVVRAARFNLPIKTVAAPTPAASATVKRTTASGPGKKEKQPSKSKKEQPKPSLKPPQQQQQQQQKNKKTEHTTDVLKKRAERFGLPVKKATKQSNSGPVQKGRVTKKKVMMNVTKDNVLSKRQQNLNRLSKNTIAERKKNIVQQRRVNLLQQQQQQQPQQQNRQNGRIVTIGTMSTATSNKNGRNVKVDRGASQPNNNGRNVIIAATPPPSNTRKRGRGGISAQPLQQRVQNQQQQRPRSQNSFNNKRRRY